MKLKIKSNKKKEKKGLPISKMYDHVKRPVFVSGRDEGDECSTSGSSSIVASSDISI